MRSALLLIEFQHDWLHPAGKLHRLAAPGMLARATGAETRALAEARGHGLPVVHAGLRFAPGYPELGRARHGLRAGIAGFALHVCVAATAWAAQDLGYEVAGLENAVAAFDPQQQATTLEQVVHHFGERLDVERFVARLRAATL